MRAYIHLNEPYPTPVHRCVAVSNAYYCGCVECVAAAAAEERKHFLVAYNKRLLQHMPPALLLTMAPRVEPELIVVLSLQLVLVLKIILHLT